MTEAITGWDLVAWQLRIAEGAPFPSARRPKATRSKSGFTPKTPNKVTCQHGDP